MQPNYDYCLAKKVQKESGVVTSVDVTKTHQLYEIIEVGPGRHENGVFIVPTVKKGDVVWVMQHATADTPKELEDRGLALFQATRIMCTEEK